jgi:restriction endonuclease S subunit
MMIGDVEFRKETGFQDTSIGKIPKDWCVQELGDESIADIIAGQSPPSSTYNRENRGLPFLQGKMEFGEMFPSPTTYCLEPIKIAKKNDVLLSVRAPVGDVNIAPSECCIGRGLAAIRAKVDKLNHLFLFYYLKLEGRRFEALSTGSTFKAIRIREIEKFSIPVPSLEEQRVVVGVLGVVDSAIGLVDRVIWKTERLKKGLMQTLLTKGLNVLTIYHNEIISAIEDCRRHVTTSEWNLTHHLAESLKRVFEKYDVDVELIKDPTNERPDIVVHKRGVNDYNLLAIEVKIKPTKTDVQQDVEKLERLMLGKYLYRSALFVGYDTTLKNEETFSLSKEVNFILVRPDGRLDSKFVEDHKEYKNTPIGEIPKNWELVRIRELGELQYGYTTSAVQENTGTKFLRITDIEEDGLVNWEQVPYCHIDGDEFGKYALQKGDLLFARIGATAGKTTYINENARGIFASYLIRLKVKEENANPKFVFYFTQSTTYWSQALRQREGQLKKGINATMLSNFTVPLPSFEEQQGTAEILSAIDHKLELERKEKARLERVKRGLMDLLLTGKVRIKVD